MRDGSFTQVATMFWRFCRLRMFFLQRASCGLSFRAKRNDLAMTSWWSLEASNGLDGLNGKDENSSRWAKNATASIGIVVAHRLHPLRDVLHQGREAEEDAKELYERNAICVRWLKRSGEQVQMGAKFFYPDHCINDTLQVLMEFAELMRTKISRGFATDLMQESFALADLDEKAQEAELRRLLKRRSELSDDQIKDWAQKLAQLAVALDTHADCNADPFDLTRPQRGHRGTWQVADLPEVSDGRWRVMQIVIRPMDVWLFRDGKPFRAGEDHAAETLFPPSPFTLQGAIRTKVLADKGVNLAEFAKNGERNPDPDVGYGENFGKLRLRGPLLMRCKDGKWERLIPMPTDVVKVGNRYELLRPNL